MALTLPDLAWSMRFLQTKQNFLNHLVNVLWFTFWTIKVFYCFHSIMAQFKLVISKIFICVAFKVYNESTTAQLVSTPTTMILPTMGVTRLVGSGWKIHWQHPCRRVRPLPQQVSWIWHLMMRFQFWSFVECGVPLHCHYYQDHSDLEG